MLVLTENCCIVLGWVLTILLITAGLGQPAVAASSVTSDQAVSALILQNVDQTDDLVTSAGRLVDHAGQPVSDAFVCLAVSRSHEITWEGPTVLAACQSDVDGRFQMSVPIAEIRKYGNSQRSSFEIWACKPGFDVATHQSLRAPLSDPVELRLEPEIPFEISLRDATGKVCNGVEVKPISTSWADETMIGIPAPVRDRFRSFCDANGRARLSGVRLDRIRNLMFSHPDYGVQLYYSRVGLPIATDLTLLPVGSLKGKLRVPDDVKVDLTCVRFRVATMDPNLSDPDDYWSGSAEVTADEKGEFSIPRIASGSVRVFFSPSDDFPLHAERLQKAPIVAEGKMSELTINLRRTIPVSQLVRDADSGEPLKNISIHFQYQYPATIARTNAEGRFTVNLIPGVSYHRYLEMPEGYLHQKGKFGAAGSVLIPNGVERHELEIEDLQRGRIVEGIVMDGSLKPFAAVQVVAKSAVPADQQAGLANERRIVYSSTMTDSRGRFVMSGIDREVDLTISAHRAGIPLSDEVHIGAGDDRVLIVRTKRFEFASVNGRVVDKEGLPVEGAKVWIYGRRADKTYGPYRTYSGLDGAFQAPSYFVKGDEYQVAIQTNKLDVKSSWLQLEDANQTIPDIVIDRNAMGFRKYIPRSPAAK